MVRAFGKVEMPAYHLTGFFNRAAADNERTLSRKSGLADEVTKRIAVADWSAGKKVRMAVGYEHQVSGHGQNDSAVLKSNVTLPLDNQVEPGRPPKSRNFDAERRMEFRSEVERRLQIDRVEDIAQYVAHGFTNSE